ncbi:MOSC N-terminal beta barrel domain-containing protein [Earliella scabrosa]|nr:MOSC N-terminal beta barrel domain-containing protein [Earliella scabrosa]
MALSFYDIVHHWAAQSPATRYSTLSILLVSCLGVLWSWTRKYSAATSNGKTGVNGCPPELLKDDLKNGVANGYTIERELSVPFDIGDVRVSKILVHPIKSCRGTSASEWRYTPQGLEYDRKWCIIEADSGTIITAREVPKMVLITPRVERDSTSPHGGRLVVAPPEDSGCETFSVPLSPAPDVVATWPIVDDCVMFKVYRVQGVVCSSLDPSSRSPSEILSQYFGRPVHLVMKGPRTRECPTTHAFPDLKASAWFQDGFPFLVASEESLEEVGRVVSAYAQDESPEGSIGGIDRARWKGGAVNIERFRPNIVFKGSGVPFAEDAWRRVVIHSSPAQGGCTESDMEESRTFTLVSKCARCLLPNVDTSTGQRDAAVPYKVLMKFRRGKDPARMAKACFGCNAVVGSEGVVRVGDRVEVREWVGGIGV